MHASSEKKASRSDSLPITNSRRRSLLALYSAENTVGICCRGGLMATRKQAA